MSIQGRLFVAQLAKQDVVFDDRAGCAEPPVGFLPLPAQPGRSRLCSLNGAKVGLADD